MLVEQQVPELEVDEDAELDDRQLLEDRGVVLRPERVLLRLEGYATSRIPGGLPEADCAPLREAMRS